jgi:outer membrane protein
MKKEILVLLLVGFTWNLSAQFDGGTWSEHPWKFRFGIATVIPNESATIGSIGGDAELSTTFVPKFDFSYFLSEKWALELSLTAVKHYANTTGSDLSGIGGMANSEINLGSVWLLPPTLTLQYHFKGETFRPYIGGGVNYTLFFNQNAAEIGPNVDYDNSLGLVFQLGFNHALGEKWFFNFDAKYIGLNTDVLIDPAGLNAPAEVNINPLIIGIGFGLNL